MTIQVLVLAATTVLQGEMQELPLLSWMQGAIVYSDTRAFCILVWMKKGYIFIMHMHHLE